MQYTIAALALAASVSAQGVSGVLRPSSDSPAGCQTTYPGTFEITVVKVAEKRDLQKRGCQSEGTAVLSLSDSILTDSHGRIGAIVANRQFQFDGPPAQTGSIYTGGWSVCADGSLALGDSNTFYQCLSGDFYNLYDEPSESACEAIHINVLPCGSSTAPAPGQVSQIPDGQPQAPSAVSQIPDGQVQAPTGAPIAQIPDGQVQAPTGAPVAQIPDGQVQAPTGAPVAQIPDGQVQAPTGAPVAQIPDGQVQAPTGAPIAQIPDGQVQNPVSNRTARPSNTTTATLAEYTGGAVAAVGAAQAGWVVGVLGLVGGMVL